MSAASPAVLVMARAPRPGEVRRALEPVLGAPGCAELQATLIAQLAAWGRRVAPDAVHVAHDPPDAARELRPLVGARALLFPQKGGGVAARLADATTRVFSRHRGPLLIVWPDLPCLRPEHAAGSLEDLRSGAELVLGPLLGGGFYLIGLARALPELFSPPERDWRNPDAVSLALAAAAQAGLEVGILRVERPLHQPADVRAALADPLLPDTMVRLLRGAGPAAQRSV
ncbi:MAG: DUF2064 domain-containing protein [Solirubrobacteraceae bacterium]